MKSYSYGRQTIDQEDIKSVIDTLQSDYLTQGPKVKEFETELCKITGAKYAVAVANGTAALHLSMLALEIGPDDAGLTSPMTFVASANCLCYVGAQVQFADIDPCTGLIDPKEIEKNITPESRVLIPVHYAGQSADMEEIHKIAQKNNLYVVEDAAHALGSSYKGHPVGSCHYSDLTVFSFHPVKTITTGEGGAITTNNKELFEKLITLRSHGITKLPEQSPWFYEMRELGYNYRLPDILASLGISQLKKLREFANKRKDLAKLYREGFMDNPKVACLTELPNRDNVLHLFPLLINFDTIKISKQELFRQLAQKGIKLQVHYIPVHLQPYYQNLGFKRGDYPIAEKYYSKTISIPLFSTLSKDDIEDIIRLISNELTK